MSAQVVKHTEPATKGFRMCMTNSVAETIAEDDKESIPEGLEEAFTNTTNTPDVTNDIVHYDNEDDTDKITEIGSEGSSKSDSGDSTDDSTNETLDTEIDLEAAADALRDITMDDDVDIDTDVDDSMTSISFINAITDIIEENIYQKYQVKVALIPQNFQGLREEVAQCGLLREQLELDAKLQAILLKRIDEALSHVRVSLMLHRTQMIIEMLQPDRNEQFLRDSEVAARVLNLVIGEIKDMKKSICYPML